MSRYINRTASFWTQPPRRTEWARHQRDGHLDDLHAAEVGGILPMTLAVLAMGGLAAVLGVMVG